LGTAFLPRGCDPSTHQLPRSDQHDLHRCAGPSTQRELLKGPRRSRDYYTPALVSSACVHEGCRERAPRSSARLYVYPAGHHDGMCVGCRGCRVRLLVVGIESLVLPHGPRPCNLYCSAAWCLSCSAAWFCLPVPVLFIAWAPRPEAQHPCVIGCNLRAVWCAPCPSFVLQISTSVLFKDTHCRFRTGACRASKS